MLGGKAWFDSRPYADRFVQMEASDRSKILIVHVVTHCTVTIKRLGELVEIMKEARALLRRALEIE